MVQGTTSPNPSPTSLLHRENQFTRNDLSCIAFAAAAVQSRTMNRCQDSHFQTRIAPLLAFAFLAAAPACPAAAPAPAAMAAFNNYTRQVESRLARQHSALSTYLAGSSPEVQARLRKGELIIEQLPTPEAPGAILHHWRGTAFAPDATAAGFERLMRDFNSYPRLYSSQILSASTLSQNGDHYQVTMRVRQQHILTVVLDTTYVVDFVSLDPDHRSSISRGTRITEIASPGTPSERALAPAEDHAFLWLLNSYWSCAQANGGLYLQIESVSLTRSIPTGLGWVVRPFLKSVPRDSLEFTLRSTLTALRNAERNRP